jgi:regulator of cell morphogenesis and NO signaling
MITASTRLSDIVFNNVQLINVISCFGIRLGIAEKTVKEVCKEHSIDLKFFISIINTYSSETYFPEVNELDVNLLIEYLKKTHSYYLNFTIPRINKLFTSLQNSLPKDKSVKHITKYFNDYKNELKKHIEFEEKYLFPLITDLMLNPAKRNKTTNSAFKRLKLEHSNVEDKLLDLKTILVRYLPESADEQLVFDLLFTIAWFEKNHENHARFEDNILIPKLKKLLLKVKTA